MVPDAPWVNPDAFPLKPESDYGRIRRGKAASCSPEQLIRECEQPGPGIPLVWTPVHDRLVTPWEVPFLWDALRSRSIASLRQYATVSGFALAILGAMAVMNRTSREFPLYAALAFALGLLPLITTVRLLRRLRAGPINITGTAYHARFTAWAGRRSHLATWLLAGCLALAGIWQLIVGLDMSTSSAGLVKPLVWQGEPWRLLTGTLIHGGWIHLHLNLVALALLGWWAESLSNRFHVLVVFLVSGLAGGLASLFLDPGGSSVGASGAILGLLGFLFVLSMRRPRLLPRPVRSAILTTATMTAVLGVMAIGWIDNAAHGGGFVAGAIIGLFTWRASAPVPASSPRSLRIAGWTAAGVVVLSTAGLAATPRSTVWYRLMIDYAWQARSRDSAEALEVLEAAIQLRPHLTDAYWTRAIVREEQKDYAGSVEDCTTALRLDPSLAGVYGTRSIARRGQKRWTAALADAEEAVRRAPGNFEVRFCRMVVRHDHGDIGGAIQDVARALEIRPNDPHVLGWRAWFHYLQGRLDEAMKDCEAALAIDPKISETHNIRGLLRWKRGEFDGANRDFDEAIRLDPRNDYAYAYRGDAALAQGDVRGASEAYRVALDLDPANPDALFGRGRVKRGNGDNAGAQADFVDALRQASPGWHRRGDVEAAMKQAE
jgi:membrane associated rhomboid family serine protease/tetratricopeptide (TPR) repeat protein